MNISSENNKLDIHERFFGYRWLLIYVKEFWWRKLSEIVKLKDQEVNGKTKLHVMEYKT